MGDHAKVGKRLGELRKLWGAEKFNIANNANTAFKICRRCNSKHPLTSIKCRNCHSTNMRKKNRM